jgi:DNA-binding MarR family transcriptional regulator
MERSGFLERRSDPDDQRVSRVYLTDAGRDIRAAVERIWTELEQVTFEGFSDEERETLETYLERIHRNLEGGDS